MRHQFDWNVSTRLQYHLGVEHWASFNENKIAIISSVLNSIPLGWLMALRFRKWTFAKSIRSWTIRTFLLLSFSLFSMLFWSNAINLNADEWMGTGFPRRKDTKNWKGTWLYNQTHIHMRRINIKKFVGTTMMSHMSYAWDTVFVRDKRNSRQQTYTHTPHRKQECQTFRTLFGLFLLLLLLCKYEAENNNARARRQREERLRTWLCRLSQLNAHHRHRQNGSNCRFF